MRTIIIVVFLMGLPFARIGIAAEGSIRASASLDAVRRTHQPVPQTNQAPEERKARSGHPIMIGALLGAGAGAIVGAISTSCADPGPMPSPCGTHPRAGGAVVGAVVGAGLGALIGFVVKKVKD
jgi:hypothetical protein